MTTTIIFTIASLSLLGLLLAVVLYLVAQKFKVVEDSRIDDVEIILPGANCGGCGYAGCRAFAEACVKAESLDNYFCPVGGNSSMQSVAEKLGFEIKEKAAMVAVVRCAGSLDSRRLTSHYDGYSSCKVKSALYSGDTGCRYGCLGEADCAIACPFDAIKMNENTKLPEIEDTLCTACGVCVKTCPKSIIELRNIGPKSRRIYVSCANKDKGAVARKACSAACISCKKCEKVCPFGAVTIEENLAYIDFNKCKLCRKCVEECPTGAITILNFPIKVPKIETKPVVEPLVGLRSEAKTEAPTQINENS